MLDFSEKPVIAMLHLKGETPTEVMRRMVREAEIYYRNGVDAVLVENYFGSIEDCERALQYLHMNMPDKKYGVNILGDHRTAFRLAEMYEADFIQIDSVCGHLSGMTDRVYADELIRLKENCNFQVLGGLRFKYQPVLSGRTLEKDAELAKLRCDAVVTTGDATAMDCPTEKLADFRKALGDFPLIVGAGVTAYTVHEKLQLADGIIVGSWLKYAHADYGDVCEEYVQGFMKRVYNFRKIMRLNSAIRTVTEYDQ